MVVNNGIILQYGFEKISGNVGGTGNIAKYVTLPLTFSAQYTIVAIHHNGNQFVCTTNSEQTLSTACIVLRNVNASTKADLQGINYVCMGY